MKVFSLAAAGVAALGLSAAPGHAASWLDSAVVKQRVAALRAQWAAQAHQGATTEPSLVAGRVLTPAVNVQVAPGQAVVSVTIDAGTVGYELFGVDLVSPDGLHVVSSFSTPPAYPPQKKTQSFTFEVMPPFGGGGFTLYSEPGNWTVAGVSILAKDGTEISYIASQVAALFPSVTVAVTNNGTPDTTPPTASHGKILTPTVSLSGASPYFAASLTVADNLSGVASASISLASTNGVFGAGTQLLAPVSAGKVVAFADLSSTGVAPGTYTVDGYTLCDAADNCASSADPADAQKLFGKNFTVQVTE